MKREFCFCVILFSENLVISYVQWLVHAAEEANFQVVVMNAR